MGKEVLDVCIVGGGMITHDLILPSIYHLQRTGKIGHIDICALNNAPLRALKESPELTTAFPHRNFIAWPSFDQPPERNFPVLYRDVLAALPPYQAVIVAVPDQFHYDVVMTALRCRQHVLCVKPLVLRYSQAAEIARFAYERGLFVGVEYHKRFDRRALLARRQYRNGDFGAFMLGEARMIEPYRYRCSNFQNWFTADQTDPFVYVGCHYVDLVWFITGLRPTAVSVSGCRGKFPNGKEGYMWTNGRIRYENGALLSVSDGLGYPDAGAGSNDQGLVMYCEGADRGGLIRHDDQYRGVDHCYLDLLGGTGSQYNYVNPDFYRLVSWDGPGLQPVGYGFDSIAAIIAVMRKIETAADGLAPEEAHTVRQQMIRDTEARGLIATPGNSSINELVIEAGRASISHDGEWVDIGYDPVPSVRLRQDTIEVAEDD
ncbi:MAG: Gfo/Idh/MocA family oxidoreductase [Victivallales bacterium]|nr:Gfo/Idh/MocA family oxidoreductase [Victivallales bacterium]